MEKEHYGPEQYMHNALQTMLACSQQPPLMYNNHIRGDNKYDCKKKGTTKQIIRTIRKTIMQKPHDFTISLPTQSSSYFVPLWPLVTSCSSASQRVRLWLPAIQYVQVGRLAFLHVGLRFSSSRWYHLLPLMVPCIGEAAGGVFEAGLRKVSGKA